MNDFPSKMPKGSMALTVNRTYVAQPHLLSDEDVKDKLVELWIYNGAKWELVK